MLSDFWLLTCEDFSKFCSNEAEQTGQNHFSALEFDQRHTTNWEALFFFFFKATELQARTVSLSSELYLFATIVTVSVTVSESCESFLTDDLKSILFVVGHLDFLCLPITTIAFVIFLVYVFWWMCMHFSCIFVMYT